MRLACLPLLALLPLSTTGCGEANAQVSFSTGGMQATTDQIGVTGGGLRRDTELPTLFYGSVLEEGTRRYTYLVVGPALEVGYSTESQNSGTATVEDDQMRSDHTFTIEGVQLSASFRAVVDQAAGTVEDETLSMQGTRMDPSNGWFFLHDFRDDGSGLTPVAIEMPRLPADAEDLAGFTEMFVADLLRTNDVVKAFVE